eukprot:gene1927-16438_t
MGKALDQTIYMHREIAKIFIKVAETGGNITELTLGFLKPLQKPRKQRGPVVNPTHQFTVYLTKSPYNMLHHKNMEQVRKTYPLEQSAYQPGRSSTEQVFAMKTLAEKAIVSNDYKLYLLLLDISKAFDVVDRKKLFEELEDILDDDELLSKITNQPELKVKVRNKVGETFTTNTGIMQEDCLSAVLFILF